MLNAIYFATISKSIRDILPKCFNYIKKLPIIFLYLKQERVGGGGSKNGRKNYNRRSEMINLFKRKKTEEIIESEKIEIIFNDRITPILEWFIEREWKENLKGGYILKVDETNKTATLQNITLDYFEIFNLGGSIGSVTTSWNAEFVKKFNKPVIIFPPTYDYKVIEEIFELNILNKHHFSVNLPLSFQYRFALDEDYFQNCFKEYNQKYNTDITYEVIEVDQLDLAEVTIKKGDLLDLFLLNLFCHYIIFGRRKEIK